MTYLATQLLRHPHNGKVYAATWLGGPDGLEHLLQAWGPLRPQEYAEAASRLATADARAREAPEELARLLGTRDARAIVLAAWDDLVEVHPHGADLTVWTGTAWVVLSSPRGRWRWPWQRR
jgi:hypothetical protein